MRIKLKYIIYFIFEIPALIIHELSHIIFLYLTLNRIDGFKIDYINKEKLHFIFTIKRYIAKYKFAEYLICLSPLIALISLYIVCILLIINGLYIFPLIFIPYSIIYWNALNPSKIDYDSIKNWKSREEIFFESLNS